LNFPSNKELNFLLKLGDYRGHKEKNSRSGKKTPKKQQEGKLLKRINMPETKREFEVREMHLFLLRQK
jgi:hypothetical protein